VVYLVPDSIEEALHLLKSYQGQARIVAGATDVMPELRQQKITPHALIDITRIPELARIHVGDDFVEIGAAVTFAEITKSVYLQQHVHALVEAAGSVGAAGIQNAATWAGNIVQAMPAADGAIVAMALEAEARVAGCNDAGVRWRPVASLFRGPGRSHIDSSCQLITHLRFARPQPDQGTAWRRLGRRPSLVLPILNCAVRLFLEPGGERIQRAVLALGPVAPHPFRAGDTEAFLRGQSPSRQIFLEAGRIAQTECEPRSSIMRASRDYRLAIIPTMVADALKLAAGRAGVGVGT
jgi:carbon-monoxide dehydrogenase medium subunit